MGARSFLSLARPSPHEEEKEAARLFRYGIARRNLMTFVLVEGKSNFTVTGEAAATGVAVSGGAAEGILKHTWEVIRSGRTLGAGLKTHRWVDQLNTAANCDNTETGQAGARTRPNALTVLHEIPPKPKRGVLRNINES
jgi:hypothetical protein